MGEEEANELLRTVTTLVACRGKKVVKQDLKKEPVSEETLKKLVLGPTGNLRAPTIRRGKTLLVGFNQEAYEATLS